MPRNRGRNVALLAGLALSLSLVRIAVADGAGVARLGTPPALDTAPAWFARELDRLTRDGGRTIADNAAYRSASEPFRAYGIEWRRSITGRSAMGRLYGLMDDGREHTFWEFYLYWDAARNEAVVMQIHVAGVFGTGTMRETAAGEIEMDQRFHSPDGSITRVRHLERTVGDTRHSQSFDRVGEQWVARRKYIWRPAP